jgi:hypothetical protein
MKIYYSYFVTSVSAIKLLLLLYLKLFLLIVLGVCDCNYFPNVFWIYTLWFLS